ncbi:MAG: TonB-dependent receptor [Bacteroidota bacterium]|nr:TonB-dependent receptor [Bacteroidota bacterium]
MMLRSSAAYITISKHDIQWQDYTGMPEILVERLPTALPLFLGLQGAYNHLRLLGSGTRDIAVMINGRPLLNSALGATFLDQLPPEMIESIEVFLGSDAVILARNASGAALNVQEIRHDTRTLFTRLWYQQFGDQYTAADVDISLNVAPNVNCTVGARTQQATRIYNNTGNRSWNARALLRWNLSSTASLSCMYLLTQQQLAANGGLLTSTTANTVFSLTQFNELQEHTFRHDITLTGSAFLTADSSVAATLSLFTSIDQRALVRASLQGTSILSGGTVLAPDETIIQATSSNVTLGATGRFETQLRLFPAATATLLIGGTMALHTIPESPYWSAAARRGLQRTQTYGEVTAFARLGCTFVNVLEVSGGVHIGVIGERPILALGAKSLLSLHPSSSAHLTLWADLSQSLRLPSPAEDGAAAPFPYTQTTLLPESHVLGIAGLRFHEHIARQHDFATELLAFARLIAHPILYAPVQLPYAFVDGIISAHNTSISAIFAYNGSLPRVVAGLSILTTWHAHRLLGDMGAVCNGFAHVTTESDNTVYKRFPLLYAGATVQVEYMFGRDILRAGVRLRLSTPFTGERFSPLLWTYLPSAEEQSIAGNGIDIVAGAEIFGNLFIRATYQNVLNSPAFTVAGYPQYPSALRLTVSAPILGR